MISLRKLVTASACSEDRKSNKVQMVKEYRHDLIKIEFNESMYLRDMSILLSSFLTKSLEFREAYN